MVSSVFDGCLIFRGNSEWSRACVGGVFARVICVVIFFFWVIFLFNLIEIWSVYVVCVCAVNIMFDKIYLNM